MPAQALTNAAVARQRKGEPSGFRVLFDSSSHPMWVVDRLTLRFLDVNDAATRTYGYSRDEFLAMRLPDIRLTGDDDCRHVTKHGDVIEVRVTSHDVVFDGRPASIAIAEDVTDRKRMEGELRYRAYHDSLTGLGNRALLRERIEESRQRGDRHAAVALLDLDGFKAVNDSCGHAFGDAVLVVVAERLRSCVRDGETVIRLGGDEFAVLLNDISDPAGARTRAERMIAALAHPIVLDGVHASIRASIGVALPEHGGGAEDLLRNADVAMYAAKERGKDQCQVFEPGMYEGVVHRLALEQDLRRAVEVGEFHLQYQPTVTLSTQQVSGFEALVRWRHPTRGTVPPGQFIDVAEATGLVVPLGRWVLEEACHQAARWQRNFPGTPPLTINVNVSARQLQNSDIVPVVGQALAESGLAHGSLVLELTESVLMQDAELSIRRLHELRALGVQLALDDFGTGYSSLSYLQRFPIDILKIDKSFIDGIHHGNEESALARAVIRLGRTLRLKTTAEGLELAEQVALVDALHCDLGQGYYFARPLDAEDVEELLARARAGCAWAAPALDAGYDAALTA